MRVIKDGRVIEDAWHLLADDAPLPEKGHAIVSVARWKSARQELAAGGSPIGVVLRSHEPPETIAERERLALIAIDFPSFTDGRGYTWARLLRTRFGYAGELRAIGDVLHDQLFYMKRCGFDSFALKAGKDIERALTALHPFSTVYQQSADTRTRGSGSGLEMSGREPELNETAKR